MTAAIESRQFLTKASACRHNTQMDLCDKEKLFRVKIILFPLVGFIIAQSLPFFDPSINYLYLLILALVGICLTINSNTSWLKKGVVFFISVATVSLGYLQSSLVVRGLITRCERSNKILTTNYTATIQGAVVAEPQVTANDEVILTVHTIAGLVRIVTIDYPWNREREITKGSIIELNEIEIKPLLVATGEAPNPLSFEGYLFREGFVATGIAKHQSIITPAKNSYLNLLQKNLVDKYGRSEALAVLLAALTAKTNLLGFETKTLFRVTGTTHLLVISGLHISTIFYACYVIFLWMFKRCVFLINYLPAKIPAMICALSIAIIYSFITGLQVSSVRAMLMATIYVASQLMFRNLDPIRSLVIIAFGISLFCPGVVYDVGCELTFLAVLGLYAARNYHFCGCSGENENLRSQLVLALKNVLIRAINSLFSCIGAWLFTAPITLLWFHSTTLASPIINFLMVASFSFLTIIAGMPVLILNLLAIPGAQHMFQTILWCIDCLLKFLSYLSYLAAEWGMGYVKVDGPYLKLWIGSSTILALSFALIPIAFAKIKKIIWQKKLKSYIPAIQEQADDLVLFSFNEGSARLSRGI